MAALGGVKVPQRGNGTPTVGKVGVVAVFLCYDPRPKVDRRSCPDAVVEVAAKGGVSVEEAVEIFSIVIVQLRGPGLEGAGGEACDPLNGLVLQKPIQLRCVSFFVF